MAVTLGANGIIFSDSTIHTSKYSSTEGLGALLSITSYTTAGSYTWTKPSGCNKVRVAVVGGGGGAAGYCESGGAGGYAEGLYDVTGVSTVAVTVGAGGSAAIGYGGGAQGYVGRPSSFGYFCTASGGAPANSHTNHAGGLGGVGSGGDINVYGGSGTGHANSAGNGAIGRGGRSYFGGAAGFNRNSNNAKAGQGAPGAGGPGARTDDGSVGGSGEAGAVIIWEYK